MSLKVQIYSFSYHLHGIPEDTSDHHGGFVFDCRCLPNPGREERFASRTGLDDEVKIFLSQKAEVQNFMNAVYEIINLAVQNYIQRGFESLMISFGCTGGQHRSVFCAERLAEYLRLKNIDVEIIHNYFSSRTCG